MFLPLDAHILLAENGSLRAQTDPADLFAGFSRPQPAAPAPQVRAAPDPASPSPHYALRKGHGFWKLTFEGNEAEIKHEQGIFYVAYLLMNPPPQPIHALDLAAKVPSLYRKQLGISEIIDPATGKATALESGARLQQRSLGLDDAAAMRALLRKQAELEAILDDENESEPVKTEALRELEALAEFQRQHGRRSADSAQRAARSVRMAIKRLHARLAKAVDAQRKAHPVLVPFAEHLQKYLLIPSARHIARRAPSDCSPFRGCFTYEPPAGVRWE